MAVAIKNIPTGPGDVINIQGVYTNGATRYNIQDLAAAAGAKHDLWRHQLAGAYQSVGFGIAPDSVFGIVTAVSSTDPTWGMRGAFTHNWDPYWSASVYGAYAGVRYDGLG